MSIKWSGVSHVVCDPRVWTPRLERIKTVECPTIELIKWVIGRYSCFCTHDMRVFCANCCVCRDQEVSCRLLTTEDRILSRGSPCGVCAKHSRHGIYSWSGTYLSPYQWLFHRHSILIHLSSRRLTISPSEASVRRSYDLNTPWD